MRKMPRVALATWRRAALVSVLLFLSTCWILLDSVLSLTAGEGTVVEIPSFCGREESEIERVPHLVYRTEYRYDESVARGVVISQEPRAGTKRRVFGEGQSIEVHLTVSLGRETRILPDLVGTEARAAVEALEELILTVSVRQVRDEAHVGRVLSQEPRAGEVLPTGETVILWVGVKAPTGTVRVPSLLGQSRAEALLSLAAAGLSLGEISETEDTEVAAGTVVSQSHLPDTTVLAGTKISITVAKESKAYVFWQRSDHGE